MGEREPRQRAVRGRDRKIARTEVEGRERLARRVERPVVTREPPPGSQRPRRDEPSAEAKPVRGRRARPVRPGAQSARRGAARTGGGTDDGEEDDGRGERASSSPTPPRPRRSTRRPS